MGFDKTWLDWRKAILSDIQLSCYAKSIALYLNTYMNDSHHFAYPSIATIQADMSIRSRSTVVKYLKELVEKGWSRKEKRYSKSSVYHIAFPENVPSSPRRVLVHEMDSPSPPGVLPVVHVMDSNKQENNQLNKQGKKSSCFKQPTAKEVQDYLDEIGITEFTGEHFVNHYDSIGWVRGKTKIKDWKACVRTWVSKGESKPNYGTDGI